MERLIDADALFKAYENVGWYNNADRDEIAEKILLEQPTVDAEPVRHGRWIDRGYMKVGYHCSLCGGYVVAGKEKYCPHCGAKMTLD